MREETPGGAQERGVLAAAYQLVHQHSPGFQVASKTHTLPHNSGWLSLAFSICGQLSAHQNFSKSRGSGVTGYCDCDRALWRLQPPSL